MYAEERQQAIALRARETGRVDVAVLAEEYRVAMETVRRDLAALERQGLLRRVHGGAILVERPAAFEPEMSTRAHVMADEKRRIAKAALDELPPDGAILCESASTVNFLAEVLPTDRALTVVTNGLQTALSLVARPNLTVLTVGGRVRRRTLAEVDDWALRTLDGVRVDVAFVGTNGVSASYGLTTPDSGEAAVKRALLGVSTRTVLLADHSKVRAVGLCKYGELTDVDVLITDDELSSEARDELEAAGLPVVAA